MGSRCDWENLLKLPSLHYTHRNLATMVEYKSMNQGISFNNIGLELSYSLLSFNYITAFSQLNR